jgi:3-deoxy-D-manno-oct-2-ulosonic acid (Kdo) hydroxylase
MPWVDVDALRGPEAGSSAALARWLEEGRILLFRRAPFPIPDEDRDFLLSRKQGGGRLHKNIAYRPARDRVTGAAGSGSREEVERLRRILRVYSRSALAFLARLFPGYARSWDVDYASFRPIEEEGRELPPTSRNDRLHVDAFPTRPTHGGRILRFFTNIHPERSREWVSGGTFDRLAPRYAVGSGLLEEALRHGRPSPADRLLRLLGARRRLPSPYDAFMLRFHDFLKENEEFQASAERERFSFPPGSSWIVLTDMVSHAVLSGRFALEQTVILGRDSLVAPELAPVAILERLAGRPLAEPA